MEGGLALALLWPRFTSPPILLAPFKHPNEGSVREIDSDRLCFSGGIAFSCSFPPLSLSAEVGQTTL